MRPKLPRYLPALVAGTAAALITAACGGSDAGSDSATDGGAGRNLSAYVECMKSNGVELTMPTGGPGGFASGRPPGGASGMPSGGPADRPVGTPRIRPSGAQGGGGRMGQVFTKPDGVDDAVWNKAVEACRSVLPSFGPRDGQDGRSGRGGASGSPAAGNGSGAAYQNCLKDHGVASLDGADPDDAAVASALTACEVLSPAPTS